MRNVGRLKVAAATSDVKYRHRTEEDRISAQTETIRDRKTSENEKNRGPEQKRKIGNELFRGPGHEGQEVGAVA